MLRVAPTITPFALETNSGPPSAPAIERAKDLRRAAGQIADQDGGGSPRDVIEWRPGRC